MKWCLAILLLVWGCNNASEEAPTRADSVGGMPATEDSGKGVPEANNNKLDTTGFSDADTASLPPIAKTIVLDTGLLYSAPPNNTKINTPQERGLLNYEIPQTMVFQKSYTIRFAITRDTSDKTLITSPSSTTATVRTSSTMSVELIDPLPEGSKAFRISKSTTDVQMVEEGDVTDWIFTVIPIRGGKHELNIVVSIIKDGNKKQTVYTNSIQVHAPAMIVTKSFFAKYWQWIIGTILLPFIVYLWQRRRKKA